MPTTGMPTLLDIAKGNGLGQEGYVEEVIQDVRELAVIPVNPISGQQYKTLVQTAAPTVAFRNANEGNTPSKGTFEQRLVECFILNPTWQADRALAEVWERGAEDFIAMHGTAILKAAFSTLCRQMYYGSDAKGFQGLTSFVDASMVVDATGTTAGGASSVWALKFGPSHVSMPIGGNGALQLSDVRIGDAFDSDNKRFTAYIQEMLAWIGLQVMSKHSVARIKNLTTQNGKGLTDSLLSQMLETFPSDPDVIIMTRRSRGQLHRSRTATNATGAEAPRPTEYEGIPIIVSECLVNTEAIAA